MLLLYEWLDTSNTINSCILVSSTTNGIFGGRDKNEKQASKTAVNRAHERETEDDETRSQVTIKKGCHDEAEGLLIRVVDSSSQEITAVCHTAVCLCTAAIESTSITPGVQHLL